MTESNPLPLVTARLIVRVMRLDDAPTFAAYRNDADIARFQGWSTPFTLDDAERFITAQADLTWPVCGDWYQVALERDGIMIGDVGVNRAADGRQATIGYSLAKPHHRFGYATEAVSAMVHLLFTEGVERVLATTDPGNDASAEVLRRVGFRHQGGDVNTEPGPGEGGDEDRYEITPAGRAATDTVTRVVAIDRALANDVGALVALETCLFDEDAGQHDRYADVTWPEREGRADFQRLLADSESVVLVARADAGVVGLLVGYLSRSSPTRVPVTYAVLRSMYVRRDRRRQGIGGQLTDRFVAWARQRGCVEVLVDSFVANAAAQSFYERHGFISQSVSRVLSL